MQYTQHISGRSSVLINQTILTQYQDRLFEMSALDTGHHGSNTEGRGTVVFFQYEGHNLVLKRYHRGGLLGKLIKDSYLYNGRSRSRMWREFLLLGQMRDLDLPVPRPVATRCLRTSWLSYQGELITEQICDAKTLAETLCSQSLPEATWQMIGRMIRRFHQHRIDHADLNAANILLTVTGQTYLIDFDKCFIRPQHHHKWCQRNLNRLLRSLKKWQARQPVFYFDDRHWQALLQGYDQLNCKTPSSSDPSLNNLRSLP